MRKSVASKSLFLVYLLFSVSLLLFFEGSFAQSSQLVLEKEQHWETYGIGGTCIPGGHNLFLKDVDGDGLDEIITGGFMYWIAGEERTGSSAPLKIWNWDGINLTLRKSRIWNTTGTSGFSVVHVADVDSDSDEEILTGGWLANETVRCAQLVIWSWNGSDVAVQSSKELIDMKGANVRSIFVSDLDKDGKPEIITAGAISNDTKSSAQLQVWNLENDRFVLLESVEWCSLSDASAASVCASDVDNDGEMEIITSGYDCDLNNSKGQLRLWTWNGNDLAVKDSLEWQMTTGYMLNIAGNPLGNTIATALGTQDIDDDGRIEIVTGGFTYDGSRANAQIKIWRWDDDNASLKEVATADWHTMDINEVKSLSIDDVDSDGRQEIVTSGMTAPLGSFQSGAPEKGQLRVWGWDGNALTLKSNEDWVAGNGTCAWNVATADVDTDGVVEIVTVGCMSLGALCDPDMRIWSIPQEPAVIPYESYTFWVAAGVVVVVAAVSATAFFLVRRKRH